MIASLPMYLDAETRPAHEAFWAGVRENLHDAGISAPSTLTHDVAPYDIWGDADLVLSHICNLPYRLHFRARLTRIAASHYPLDDCDPGYYRARFIVRQDHKAERPEDLFDCAMAYNDAESHSGWGAAATWAMDSGRRLRPTLRTGAHEASLLAVASGNAEFATIDAWTLERLKARRAEAKEIRVVGSTDQSPGMTFVTRQSANPALFRSALIDALENLTETNRTLLGLQGFPVLPERAYEIPLPPKI